MALTIIKPTRIDIAGVSAAVGNPKITSLTYPGDDTATDTAGGVTVTINGSGFVTGATVLVNLTVPATTVTVVSSTLVTFTAPAMAVGTYALYLVNPNGGTAINVPGISYSGTPTWTTAAGTVGTTGQLTSVNFTVTATGDAPVTYSVASGSLPTGVTLNSSTGVISGTAPTVESSSTTFNFTISATDAQNQNTNRAFSLTITGLAPGQVAYTTPGTYSWTAPAGVSSVSVVAIGGGGGNTVPWSDYSSGLRGGSGGGELRWKNNITVIPGNSYQVVVGGPGQYGTSNGGVTSTNGGNSSFNSTTVLANGGGRGPNTTSGGVGGSGGTGDGGGNGGAGGNVLSGRMGGGGGAGGYSGNGGAGGNGSDTNNALTYGQSGSGGGAGGGRGGNVSSFIGNAGGGTGIFGEGASGAGDTDGGFGARGGDGSGGSGGSYGGSASANSLNSNINNFYFGNGVGGAVRIIWGTGRAFPSTLTTDQTL